MQNFPFRAPAASAFAEDMDLLFFALTALTILFSVLVGGLIIFLSVRYRRGNKVDRSRPLEHHTAMEMTWIFGPMILALAMFVWSAKLFAEAFGNAPANAKEIFVVGKQWMWHVQHTNGIRENNEIHLPVDQPVRFTMISQDVVHALFVPEFRIQRQVFPGRYTSFWVHPTKTGKFHLYCNMYCGTQHSEMGGWVYVMSKNDYQKWAASGGSRPAAIGGSASTTGGVTMEQAGAALYQQYQCSSCHSSEAVARGRGPTLAGLYGKMRQLADGRKVKADDGYLRNVIYYPQEYPLAGYPQGMPAYKGVLTEEQVLQINAYIKTLGKTTGGGGNRETPETGGAPIQTDGSAAGGASTQGSNAAAVPGGTGTEPQSAPQAQGAPSTDGGNINPEAPAANTDNQQWRYMYGGER